MDNRIGTDIKGYELRERIGGGGFGVVYRAYQPAIGRDVAIKFILPEYSNQPDFIRRFETEAQLVARLEHPHITPLYDYWRDPDGAYLVMRWLRGGSLRDALQRGPFDLCSAALLLDQIAGALWLSHRSGVIHRDLKPGNILLDEDGNAYLADFGIAKDLKVPGNNTQPDVVVGSPDYISPEQARSEPVTPRTDIYSLGVVLYEILTGHHPFQKMSAIERLYKHISDKLPELTGLDTAIESTINQIIQKATAKNPDHRYSDALGLATDFREAAGFNSTPTVQTVEALLTPREHEILGLIIDGRSNKEIAQFLTVTHGTVKWYVNQIYSKLHVRSRVQAIIRAREFKLIGGSSGYQAGGTVASVSKQPEPDNPYKGLRAFQPADEQDFFGRDDLTHQLLKRLAEVGVSGSQPISNSNFARFLTVIGPSGSGKSSLVKAGLIPAIWRGELPGSEKWFVVEMLPGAHPLDKLEVALMKVAANRSDSLNEQLARDKRGLLRASDLILPDDASELVLVIDQFEEVFTLVEDEAERQHFLDLLRTAVKDVRSRIRVVITLRADFYDRPLHYSEFGELVRSRMETVMPLSAKGLERAIAGPAERAGVKFEPGLVEAMVAEMNYQAGALPLLQYALTELFERREGRLLTHKAYQEVGGAGGALAKRADELFLDLTPDGQEAARQMFMRLVTLGEGVEDTRRRVLRSELQAISLEADFVDDLIDTYANYRLFSLDNDPATRAPTVELAHEAILREWERLRSWVNDSRDEIKLQRQLAILAAEWEKSGRDYSFLLRGVRLEMFEKWSKETKLALTPDEHAYLQISLNQRDKEQAAEQERQTREKKLEHRVVNGLRALVIVFALATVIAIGLTVLAFGERNNAQNNFTRAERIRLAGQAQIALDQGEDVRIPALLAIRSLELGYSPEADAALLRSLGRSSSQQIYIGHTDGLSSASFSPDGRYVLTASNDATARLWDTQTGKELRQFLGHSGLVNQAIFSPDGQYVLTDGTDGTVRQWDVSTGKDMRHLLGAGSSVWALSFSPNGQYIVTSDDSGSAKLWDFESMKLVREFIGHTDRINRVAFSPNGRYLVTGSFDRTARLWDVETGNEIRRFEGHAGCVCWVNFSPDGNLLVTASSDSTARIWDVNTGVELHSLSGHTGPVASAMFSPDGRLVVTAGRTDQTVRLWDVKTSQELQQLRGHTDGVIDAEFSPDGRFIISASTDNTARLWDLSAKSEPKIFRNPLAIIHANSVILAALSNDNGQVVTVNGAGKIQFWDVETGEVLHEFATENGGLIVDAAFSPDEHYLVTPGRDGIARLWDVITGQKLREYVGQTAAIKTVSFSPNSKFILTGAEDGSSILWDVDSGKARQHFVGHTGSINSVAFSPDNDLIATAGDDATVRLWDIQTGMEIRKLVGHNGAVFSVAFSPNGQLILTGGKDNTARLWDVHSGQEIRQFDGHILPVWRVAFSPDGQWVLTASLDQTVRIWETDSGRVIRYFVGHEYALRSVTMSSNSKLLLTGDYNAAYLWRVDLEDDIKLACNRISEDLSADERVRYQINDDTTVCARQSEATSADETIWTPIPTGHTLSRTPLPTSTG